MMLMNGIMFFGCSNNSGEIDKGVYFENFDNLATWTKGAQLTNARAHSGSYSTCTDSLHDFTQTFDMLIRDTKHKGYKSVDVSAWCLKESDSPKSGLAISIVGTDGNVAYASVDLAQNLKKNKSWGLVNVSLNIPANASPEDHLRVYINSTNRDTVFMDDVKIKFNR